MHGFSQEFSLFSLQEPEGIGGRLDDLLPEGVGLPCSDVLELSPQLESQLLPESFFFDNDLHFPPEAPLILMPTIELDKYLMAKYNLNSLLTTNKKLYAKIRNTLKFINRVTQNNNNNTKNLQDKGSELVKNTKTGPFIINRITNNKNTLTKQYPELEQTKQLLLAKLKTWSSTSRTHKPIIDMLENYKRQIQRYIEEYFGKNNDINEFVNALWLYKASREERKEHEKLRKGKYLQGKSVWNKLDHYFVNISPEVKKSFDKLLTAIHKDSIPDSFLNMSAVNQLAAIGKMLQYCIENRMTTKEFMEDRIYQKLKAKYKQCTDDNTMDKLIYTPTLDEIPYLLSLENNSLDQVVSSLKDRINSKGDLLPVYSLEEELNDISLKNKRIIKQIQKRINNKPIQELYKHNIQEQSNTNIALPKINIIPIKDKSKFQVLKNLVPFPLEVCKKNNKIRR